MSTPSTRASHPVADLIGWLEGEAPPSFTSFGLTPRVRIEDYVEEGEYVLRAELPGIDPEHDLSVEVDGDVLTIRGERSDEMRTKDRHELHYGSFARSVTLPAGVDPAQVRADYADGVLELRAPMADVTVEPRRIPIQRRGE